MSEATCPYCKEAFEPDDHYKSGPYECPECSEVLWLDVDFEPLYEASCLKSNCSFVRNEKLSVKHNQTVMICERCGAVDLPDIAKGGEA